MKHMPKVMQDQVKGPGGTRSFSTSARSRMPDVQESSDAGPDPTVDAVASMISQANEQAAALHPGLKFEPPETPANTRTMNFRRRYDSLQELFTKVLMKHGKLARAQKVGINDHIPFFYKDSLCSSTTEYGCNPRPPPHRPSTTI